MCGAAECAFRASVLSHFSTTTKVSGPNLVWNEPMPSVSTVAPYSMQPFSAFTAGTLARKWPRISSRLPGLAVMTAMTWIMMLSPSLSSPPAAQHAAGQAVVGGDNVLAVAPDDLAVDDHGGDAVRLGDEAVGAGRQIVHPLERAGADGLRVEHHDV